MLIVGIIQLQSNRQTTAPLAHQLLPDCCCGSFNTLRLDPCHWRQCIDVMLMPCRVQAENVTLEEARDLGIVLTRIEAQDIAPSQEVPLFLMTQAVVSR